MNIISICARGGSAGLPGKNIRLLQDKPLIAWTIEQARESGLADRIIVSTDSLAIAKVALEFGAEVPFLRPDHLATFDAPKLPVIQHMVEWVESAGTTVDVIIDLDPTSPLRAVGDIINCVAMLDDDTDLVITGCESDKNPYFNMVEVAPDGYAGLVCKPQNEVFGRQGAPKVYAMNASIYVWRRTTLTGSLWSSPRVRLYAMPRERSIDIDHPVDFDLVELIMQKRKMA